MDLVICYPVWSSPYKGRAAADRDYPPNFFLQNNHYPRAVSPLFQHGSDGHGEDIAIVLNPVWYALKIVVSQNTLYSRSIERLSQLCSAPNILYSDMTIRSDRWWC